MSSSPTEHDLDAQLDELLPTPEKVAAELIRVDREIKAAEKRKATYRGALFDHATEVASKRVLARKVITLEKGWLGKVGISLDDFLTTRYPQWNLVEIEAEEQDDGTTLLHYLLEENPVYQSFEIVTEIEEDDKIEKVKTGRSIQQNDPTFDFDTLKRDMPEVFDRIMVPVISYELDEVAVIKVLEEDPSLHAKLQLHMSFPKPITKLSPSRVVKEDG